MICHYWYFKDTGYKYEPHVCNGCHDLSMVVYDLNDFMILSMKGVDYRFYVDYTLNNSWLHNKRIL